ncbi:MAG: hypothetical protein SCALA702_22790 [Melioribacteraceae bacterium]|nr:MAG: hypothetical protein SCALA702_22790 [Melioribacteraceae bacterium]
MENLLRDLDGEEKINVMLDIAVAYGRDYENRLYYASRAFEQSVIIDYPFGYIEGAANIAYSYYFRRDYNTAINYFTTALQKAVEVENNHLIAVNNHRLGNSYQKISKNDSAKYYFKLAINYWEQNYEGRELDYYFSANNLGLIYWRTSAYDSAITYYRKAKELAELLGGKKRIAAVNNNIGVIYWQWGIHDKAIEYYSESLNIRKELQDSSGMAKLYNNIGLAYLEHKNYPLAEEYFRTGLQISTTITEHNTIGYSYNNLGRTSFERGKYLEALNYYEESLEEYKFLENSDGVSLSYNDISLCLNKLGRYTEAIQYANDALQISIRKENKNHKGIACRNLGTAYAGLGNFDKSFAAFDTALSIAKEINALILLRDTYEALADAHKSAKNTKEFTRSLELFYDTKVKIQNENSSNRLLEFQTRLETLEAKQKLEETEYQLANRVMFLYILSGFLVILLIVIIFIYRLYKSRNKAYQELNIKTELLNELNATKDKILSVIAHDLKNPMGTVQSYSQMMMHDYNDMTDAERMESMTGIYTSIKVVLDILENLLTWARSQRGLIEAQIEKFDISEVLAKLEYNLTHLAEEKKIELIISRNNSIINSDRFFIETILNNLLTNGIKFTNSGGTVELDINVSDKLVTFIVKDNGVGMKPEVIKTLFSHSKSGETRGTNMEKGTGLGLIICQELADILGGKISVDSEVNNGSVFSVEIPVT